MRGMAVLPKLQLVFLRAFGNDLYRGGEAMYFFAHGAPAAMLSCSIGFDCSITGPPQPLGACRAGHLQTADSEANTARAFVSASRRKFVSCVCVQAPKPGCRGKGKIQHSKITDSLIVWFQPCSVIWTRRLNCIHLRPYIRGYGML